MQGVDNEGAEIARLSTLGTPWQMDGNGKSAAQTLCENILEHYGRGCKPEEIANQVLCTDPETAVFRVALLVEIVVEDNRHLLRGRGVTTDVG